MHIQDILQTMTALSGVAMILIVMQQVKQYLYSLL
jgi:hypothetical protein